MNRSLTLAASLTLAGILFGGCRPSDDGPAGNTGDSALTFDIDAMREVIEEKNRQFTQAHITGDSTVLINYFTHDARVFPPNSEPVVGHPAIAALNAESVALDIREFREETTSFYGNQDYLIDEGNYYVRYGEANTVETGKYLNVWRLENGEWRVCANIWNRNAPLPPEG